MTSKYDSRCYDLAEAMLADVEGVQIQEEHREELAHRLQDTVEEYVHDLGEDSTPPEPPEEPAAA